jgi:hypothetical protein
MTIEENASPEEMRSMEEGLYAFNRHCFLTKRLLDG